MSDLLPCPFCGGKNLFVTTNEFGGFCLTCKSCDAVGPPAEYEPEQMREAWNTRATIAALEPMDKPRVKPLVWKLDDSRTAYAQSQYFADRYCIEHRLHGDDAFDLWIGPDAVKATRHATIEAAKAAAQADYEARILAAIEPAPVSVREAARALLGHTPKITAKPLAEMSEAMKIDAHPAILLRGFCAALRAIAEGRE